MRAFDEAVALITANNEAVDGFISQRPRWATL